LQLVVYFALLLAGWLALQLVLRLALRLASPDVDGVLKPLATCRWSDAAVLTSICRTGVRNGVRTGVRYGVRNGVRTLDSEDCREVACHLPFRWYRLADIYMSMPSVPRITAIAGGGSRSDRCVSLAVTLLIFAFSLDRPAA
jgi:hypothetical protein